MDDSLNALIATGNQYDLRSHLDAKKKAAEFTRQSPSLLRQFRFKTEPPEWCIQAGDLEGSGTASEGDGDSTEPDSDDGLDISDDLASLVYDSTALE